MRISLVIPSFYPAVIYGGPIAFSNTCRELANLDGVEIFVSTTNMNMNSKLINSKLDVVVNKFIQFENNLFVKYYDETFVGKFSRSMFFNIWKDIKKSDVVHVQAIFNTSVPIGLFWARFFNKPTVLTPRGSLGMWALKNGSRFKNSG